MSNLRRFKVQEDVRRHRLYVSAMPFYMRVEQPQNLVFSGSLGTNPLWIPKNGYNLSRA
jgi:hypothetical protein